MKRSLIVLALAELAACAHPGTPRSSSHPPAAGHEARGPSGPDIKDVRDELAAMNAPGVGAPPAQLRAGHVTPSTLDPSALTRTASGFVIKLPSGAPITTPAVYGGKVFVSGGFRSRDFYAFQAKTGKLQWAIGLDDDGPSSPACAEGVCVFNTESCTIFAVDAETGRMLWSWWLGDPLTSSPAIAGGVVFASYPASAAADGKPRPANASHVLAAFDLKTGRILWQKWIDSDVMSSPVAVGDFVYATTFAGTVLKLEQKTGGVRYAIRARATSAPVVLNAGGGGAEQLYYTRRVDYPAGGKRSYNFSSDTVDGAMAEPAEAVTRMDDNQPQTTYTAKPKAAKYLDPAVERSSAYGADGSSDDKANGFAMGAPAAANPDAAMLNIGLANVSTMQAFQGSRVLHLGNLNVSTMGDEVLASDAATGAARWSYKLAGNVAKSGGFLATSPLAAGDSVMVATLAGDVVRLDPKAGKVRATYRAGAPVRSQPVVVDGWIYAGTQDGKLIAINTKESALTGWPMWGANAARTGIR